MTHQPDEPTSWPDDDEMDRAPLVRGLTFWDALLLAWGSLEPAGNGADPEPLADYVAARGHRLSRHEAAALADLLSRLPTRQVRGTRGKAKQPRSAVNVAERQEVLRVIDERRAWLAQHPTYKHAPTNELIGPGFDLDRIRGLLKNKRRLGSA